MGKTKYDKYIIEDFSGRPESDCRDEDEFQKEFLNIALPIAYIQQYVQRRFLYRMHVVSYCFQSGCRTGHS